MGARLKVDVGHLMSLSRVAAPTAAAPDKLPGCHSKGARRFYVPAACYRSREVLSFAGRAAAHQAGPQTKRERQTLLRLV